MQSNGPIGVFDSGVGGLSVWREIRRQLPHESTLYLADQAHVPYGPRHMDEIRGFCEAITRFLLDQQCKAIVVACNTASAAALKHLREQFPGLPVIGMEPAVKPAAASTRSGVVGIMATQATFQGRLFAATAGRYAQHLQLINQVCHGLAERIEAGHLDDQLTEAMLRRFIQPMLDANADTIVLACTHYPFVLPLIRRLAGDEANVIDPAPAIARYLLHVLREKDALAIAGSPVSHQLVTTADLGAFDAVVANLVDSSGTESWAATWDELKLSRG